MPEEFHNSKWQENSITGLTEGTRELLWFKLSAFPGRAGFAATEIDDDREGQSGACTYTQVTRNFLNQWKAGWRVPATPFHLSAGPVNTPVPPPEPAAATLHPLGREAQLFSIDLSVNTYLPGASDVQRPAKRRRE